MYLTYNSTHTLCWFDGKVINKVVGSHIFDMGIDYKVCYSVGNMVKNKERCWLVPLQLIIYQRIRTSLALDVIGTAIVLSNVNVRSLQDQYRLIVEMVDSVSDPDLMR